MAQNKRVFFIFIFEWIDFLLTYMQVTDGVYKKSQISNTWNSLWMKFIRGENAVQNFLDHNAFNVDEYSLRSEVRKVNLSLFYLSDTLIVYKEIR